MESKLIRRNVLVEISELKDISTMLARLLQTDYKDYVQEFGNISERADLVDFALNSSLAVDVKKLVRITPKKQRDIMAKIVGMWDVYDIKLILHTKSINKGFDDISKYVVETNSFDDVFVKELLGEPDMAGVASRLMKLKEYREEVDAAMDVYNKTGNTTEANAAVDKVYYRKLGATLKVLDKISPESAKLVRLDIDMRNVLTLLRAKRYGMEMSKVEELLISNGTTTIEKLLEIYKGAKDINGIASGIKSFELKKAMEGYEKNRHMLLFEIGMRNQIFKKALSLLRHSMLSFGALVGYLYLKEIEVFTLRISIMGRLHGLTSEEIAGMMEWQM